MSSPSAMPDMRNLILAVVLSTALLLGWQYFVEQPKREEAAKQAEIVRKEREAQQLLNPDVAASIATQTPKSRVEQLAQDTRVTLQNDALSGSVNLRGLRIDDLALKQYFENPEDKNEVELLSPAGATGAYFAEFGWLSGQEGVSVPDADTQWHTTQTTLSAKEPLVATWDNGTGLAFEQRIEAKDRFLFAVEQRVTNNSAEPVTLYPYGLINRSFKDTGKHFMILHEGPIGVFDQTLTEVSYETLRSDKTKSLEQVHGWLGITDKYWLSALIPDSQRDFNATMKYTQPEGDERYQTDYRGNAMVVKPGESMTYRSHFFAGAKEVSLLETYGKQLNIPLFDRAVDFGMLYFLTKPIFHALTYFHALLGNFGLAILLLTVCIKLLLFPLANKSYASMSQLKLLMPKITEIRERFGDDKLKMNQEIMELYKREKVNPASGCLPILLQLPVFFALYKVLFVTIEMRHAPFYGWIKDLSAADPTTLFNLFGLIPWAPPAMLMIGAWPLIMCGTMVIQQRLNPTPSDPAQAMVMKWLPFIFLFLFASFPAGLVIYWAWNNTLSILQQWLIQRRHKARYGTGS